MHNPPFRSAWQIHIALIAITVVLSACGTPQRTAALSAASPVAATATGATLAPTVAATLAPTEAATLAPTTAVTAAATATTIPQPTNTAQPAATASPAETAIVETPVAVAVAHRLRIPKIGVNAFIENVGLSKDGAMDVPARWEDVGWYQFGPQPGKIGNAVVAGHLDSDVAPAVFWSLGNLAPGDHVFVDWDTSGPLDFVVQSKQSYQSNVAPLNQIFGLGQNQSTNLNLITCGGSWNAKSAAYTNRLVVYTTRAT